MDQSKSDRRKLSVWRAKMDRPIYPTPYVLRFHPLIEYWLKDNFYFKLK